jgi:hypothetical protein
LLSLSLRKRLSNTGRKLFTYKDITLKLYLQIVEEYNFRLLIIQGEFTDEECINAWEMILRESSTATNNLDYLNYFETLKAYAILINEYNFIKACLLKISLMIDYTCINYLCLLGYNINTSNSAAYARSIEKNARKSNNLMTKILTKQKELELYASETQGSLTNIEEILGNISEAIGRELDDTIKLARFNFYKNRILNKKPHGRTR